MKRRAFLQVLGTAIAGIVALPTTTLSYDPVKQKVVKPKIINGCLLGYKGNQFLEAGIVYAPYIPIYKTPPWL